MQTPYASSLSSLAWLLVLFWVISSFPHIKMTLSAAGPLDTNKAKGYSSVTRLHVAFGGTMGVIGINIKLNCGRTKAQTWSSAAA